MPAIVPLLPLGLRKKWLPLRLARRLRGQTAWLGAYVDLENLVSSIQPEEHWMRELERAADNRPSRGSCSIVWNAVRGAIREYISKATKTKLPCIG